MRLPESEREFRNALVDAAEVGAMKALIETNQLKPYLSKREANRKYGTAIVNRWIKERLIWPIQDGTSSAKMRIDRIQIETVAKASNRATYLLTEER